jgi:hypothetical protein
MTAKRWKWKHVSRLALAHACREFELTQALLVEESALWTDLPATASRTIPNNEGDWSMETHWQIERIKSIAKLVGLTHRDDLPRLPTGLADVYDAMALQYPTAQAVDQ